MRALNFRHLLYFWTVARHGGVTKAAEHLHLTPQSISGQLHAFEEALGERLVERRGRRLELTEAGRVAFDYAEEIFALGNELQAALRHGPRDRVVPFRVGIADIVSKAVARELLAPVLALAEPVRLVCREWRLEDLLAELAVHRLDLVVADRTMPPELGVRAYNHLLGESGVGFFAAPGIAGRLEGPFPRSLDGAPLLLPGEDAAVRQRLLRWLDAKRIAPRIVGEFDDPALLNAFGRAGLGVFPAPLVVARQIVSDCGVVLLGAADVVEQFYAISMQRRVTHPALLAVGDAARRNLFAPGRAARKAERWRGPGGAARRTKT